MSTGQTLDQVLDMSWKHIQISADAIMRHKGFILEIIFDAVATGLGGKKSKGSKNNKSRSNKRSKRPLTEKEKVQKDAMLLHSLQNAGFKV